MKPPRRDLSRLVIGASRTREVITTLTLCQVCKQAIATGWFKFQGRSVRACGKCRAGK